MSKRKASQKRVFKKKAWEKARKPGRMRRPAPKLPEIKLVDLHWGVISKRLPLADPKSRGRPIDDDRDIRVFKGILLIIRLNLPFRISFTRPDHSNDSMHRALIRWSYAGYLQVMWAKYLDLLNEDQIGQWLESFDEVRYGRSTTRQHSFWFHDLARILKEKAEKRGLEFPTGIQLPEKP